VHSQQNIKIVYLKITSFLPPSRTVSNSQNYPEEACTIPLLNFWNYLHKESASYQRRLESSAKSLWELEARNFLHWMSLKMSVM